MVGSWTDWDLSELGIEQAERIGQKLAKQLSGHKIVMYASDLLRAKHTAEIVAKHMGITPNIRTELRERNLGKCVGKSVQWLRENIEVQEKTIIEHHEHPLCGRRYGHRPFGERGSVPAPLHV